jgi:hypothetical protein
LPGIQEKSAKANGAAAVGAAVGATEVESADTTAGVARNATHSKVRAWVFILILSSDSSSLVFLHQRLTFTTSALTKRSATLAEGKPPRSAAHLTTPLSYQRIKRGACRVKKV